MCVSTTSKRRVALPPSPSHLKVVAARFVAQLLSRACRRSLRKTWLRLTLSLLVSFAILRCLCLFLFSGWCGPSPVPWFFLVFTCFPGPSVSSFFSRMIAQLESFRWHTGPVACHSPTLDSPHGLKGGFGGWVASLCSSLVNIIVSAQGAYSPSHLAFFCRRQVDEGLTLRWDLVSSRD